MSARSSLPATLTPGDNGNSWAGMPVLRDDLRANLAAPACAVTKKISRKKSGGELRRALHKIARPGPEPLQAAERRVGGLQIFQAHGGVRKPFRAAPVTFRQGGGEPRPLFRPPAL